MNRARSVLSFGIFSNQKEEVVDATEGKDELAGSLENNYSGAVKEPVEVDLLELRNIRDKLELLQVENDRISKETFLQVVLDATEHDKKDAESFFELLDVSNVGSISLQRFISGYSLFCHVSTSERVRYLFYMFDEDVDGVLKLSDLEELEQFIHKYIMARGYSINNKADLVSDILHASLPQKPDSDNSKEQGVSFENFQELSESSAFLISFLKYLEEMVGPINGTLRETKEGDLLAVELERMSTSASTNWTNRELSSQDKSRGTKPSIRRTKRDNFSSPFAIDYESLTFVCKIGNGSFAEVWAGQWLHMPVAIKVFRSVEYDEADTNANELRMKNFLTEVETLSQLRHPNVLLYMGACVDPEKPLCIVSELFNGGSVYDYLHGLYAKPFSLAQATHVALGVARGMHYLHSSIPIVLHRDLKSSNVLIDKHVNHVVICDFGLSILADNRSQSTRKKSSKNSIGTPYTMAPEVMFGETYRSYSDVYSFSILLWEIFTGRQPFSGLKPIQMMFQVSEGKRPPLVVQGEEFCESPENLDSIPDAQLLVPRSIAKLIQRGWNTEPEKRPAFEDILLELEQFQAEISSQDESNFSIINQKDASQFGFHNRSEEVLQLQRCMTLMNAVAKNDTSTVEQHLAMYPQDISFADYDQRTPLHIAASEGHIDMVRLLLKNGANAFVSDRWQRSPLDDAVSNKHDKVVELFNNVFNLKKEIWAKQQTVATSVICLELMDAVFGGDVERVALLLEAGAPVNYSDYDRRTPLHVAASEGHVEVVRLLLKYGANTNKVDRWGSTPLDDAKRGNFEDCVLILKSASPLG
ncbi:Probable serine/threonine-protein kinase [Galdieria sulphuraria]|uniref:Serine/threonine protein kinase n=1 Tax=Galdieria sulphuraria TaxID=130081 RepID=M2Y9R1_GALSU|nr:serine/threonine protein kinase [Galdieria sulphuraria]EME32614.1 serine/threonine protein kinase [Galdieria sulphuraria]GJD12892.1 Probable serine/threonine-protein kinase [Galdieria sulphuraria]|eukprot:XP_005709134.1 serine/threonine protein kinase [Galdieria sulphuraria]